MILKNNGSIHNPDKCISEMKVMSNVIKTEFNHIGSFAKANLSNLNVSLVLSYII